MKIKQIQEDYNLTKEDFWQHPQSGKYVLYHNAVEKIAAQENIELVNYDTLNSQLDLVRFVMTLKMGDKTITDIGEADIKNCKMGYLGCMSWKRGFDRCVLKLIKAYQYDIVSEEEADDWKFQYQSPTDDMKTKYQELLKHKAFDSKRPEINRRWKDQHNNYMQNMALDWMQSQIDEHEKAKKTDATDIVKEQNENLKRISKEG
tara:strand:+ start:416 stop:1027 length:612 start_codon:yes stop_codon:yes gene_type:complete